MAYFSRHYFFLLLTCYSLIFNFYDLCILVSSRPLEFDMELNEIKTNKIGHNTFDTVYKINEIIPLRVLPQEVLTMNVCLGRPSQCFNVIYDTGSYHLWLPSNNSLGCASCKSFDLTKSNTFKKQNKKIILNYLTGAATGWEVTDYLKVEDEYLIISWMLADYVVFNVEGADGIIGFARDYTPSKENAFVNENFSLIDSLYMSNTINKRVFSQNYTNVELTKAKLYIGEYTDDFSSPDKYTYCNVIKSDRFFDNSSIKNLWTCRMSYIIIGNSSLDNFYINSHEINSRAVFDSGSNYIIAPFDIVPVIKEMFYKFKDCSHEFDISTGILVFSCTENFDTNLVPNFSFIFNGHAYTILSNKLFKEYNLFGKKAVIFVILFSVNMDFWLLGQYFLRNFHILFDNDKNIVGFNGQKEYVTDFSSITDDNDFYLSDHWDVILFLFIFMIVLVAFGALVCQKRYRREQLNVRNNNMVASGIVSDNNYYNRF